MQLGDAAEAPGESEQEAARGQPQGGELAALGAAAELADLAPVAHRLKLVRITRPGCRASAPTRGLQRVASRLPVVSEERGTLLEAVLVEVLDRARDRRDVERVSTRALADELGEPVERRVATEQLAQQFAARRQSERREGEAPIAAVAHPRAAVLRPEGEQQQRAGVGDRVDHAFEK